MTQRTRETLVGGLVLAAFAIILVWSYGARGLSVEAARRGYVVSGTFNKVDGLVLGGQVHLGGIRVGTVEGMALDADYRAVVTMRIDPVIVLPRDSSAAIHTDGLFGSKYVVLEPGGDEKPLANGDRIDFTQDAMIVSDLLELIIAQGKARLAREKEGAAP